MKKICLLPILLLMFVVSCRHADLHHNLQEIEADEILVVLHQNGIEARKIKEVSGQEVSWKIEVPEANLAKARQILISNNLPRKRELGLSGVYKEKGLIPTPDEQKARFLLALKGEIINSLQKIPGVVEADVVLNIPTESEFAELDPVKRKPTASVVVKIRNDELIAQTLTESKLQRFVANTIPNMDPNDVTVIVSRTETGVPVAASKPPVIPVPSPNAALGGATVASEEGGEGFVEEPSQPVASPTTNLVETAGLKIDPGSVGRFKAYIIGLLFLLAVVSLVLLVNIVRLNRVRFKAHKSASPPLPAGESPNLLGEGESAQGGLEGTFDVGGRNSTPKGIR